MLVSIKVFPEASRDMVEVDKSRLRVFVRAPAKQNMANIAVIRVLAEHFDCNREDIKIKSGHKAMNKIIEIPEHINVFTSAASEMNNG